MESEGRAKLKWKGKISAELRGSSAQHIWLFLADFCNLHKIFPGLETCYQVEGVPDHSGLIRYCAGPATDNDESTVKSLKWSKEKLVAVDPIKRCLSYEILETNEGFKSYVSTMQVVPLINDDEGCMIEWSFVCDPIERYHGGDWRTFSPILNHVYQRWQRRSTLHAFLFSPRATL